MPAVIPNRNAVRTPTKMSDIIKVVEEAFRTCGEGRGRMLATLPGCEGLKMGRRAPRKSISWSTLDVKSGGNQ